MVGVGDPVGKATLAGLGELDRDPLREVVAERGASIGGRMLAERGFASSLRRHLQHVSQLRLRRGCAAYAWEQ